MKTRFTTLDIAASVVELQKMIGGRCANIYDIDYKTYLFKLSASGANAGDAEAKKSHILIESGVRVHKTEFSWPKSNFPSSFSIKLRKHIRTKRLIAVSQVGSDRVIMLQFGEHHAAYYVFIELYAKGNVILTDADFTILYLLRSRSHTVKSEEQGALLNGSSQDTKDDNLDVQISVGEKFPFALTRGSLILLSKEKLLSVKNKLDHSLSQSIVMEPGTKTKKEAGSSANPTLKKVINENTDLGPALTEHTVLTLGYSPDIKFLAVSEHDYDNIVEKVNLSTTIIDTINNSPCKGYIIQREQPMAKIPSKSHNKINPNKAEPSVLKKDSIYIYDEYHPILLEQHKHKNYLEFSSFNLAIDEFYSSIEQQKIKLASNQQEKAITDKMEKVINDHQTRVKGLEKEQATNQYLADLIDDNLELVDEMILAVKSLLDNSIDWDEIQDMLLEAKSLNDPVAMHIHELQLDKSKIVILLKKSPIMVAHEYTTNSEHSNPHLLNSDKNIEDGDHQVDDILILKGELTAWQNNGYHKLTIDLTFNAHKNAMSFYTKKKRATAKELKTIEASARVVAAVEKEAHLKLKHIVSTKEMIKQRKVYWFEKFIWFISSDNFLVIAGRDAQQNEIIVKRYFRKGDIYVHADIHGASTCIIKNNNAELPIPARTMHEAGTMAVCFSSAWDAKIVVSSYWVEHNQVSKTAPTGEYLTVGSFMIRGKKNFLQPTSLTLGVGLLFKLSDDSIAAHLSEKQQYLLERNETDGGNNSIKEEAKLVDFSALEYERRAHAIQQRTRPGKQGKSEVTMIEITSSPPKDQPAIEALSDTSMNSHVQSDTGIVEDQAIHYAITGKKKEMPSFQAQAATKANAKKKELKLQKNQAKERASLSNITTSSLLSSISSETKDISLLKRGNKNKMKRAIAKYGDQDDEDKIEFLLKNQPFGKVTRAQLLQELQTSTTKMDGEVADAIEEDEPKVGSINPTSHTHPDNQEEIVAIRKERRQQKKREDEEVQQLLKEENILGEEELASLSVLDELTGRPLLNDELMYVIPVCAPYSVLMNYTYRVKLTPGTQKKGKASSIVRELFTKNADSENIKHLIKVIPDSDFLASMPSRVKISAPQLQSVLNKPKSKKN